MRTKFSGFLVLMVSLLLIPMAASASLYSYTLSNPNSALSIYSGPYATVTVSLDDSNKNIATITALGLTNSTYKYLLGDGGSLALNVNSSKFSVTNITGTQYANFKTPNYINFDGVKNVSDFGVFNATIKTFDGFDCSSNQLTLTLTNNAGNWNSASDVLINNDNNNVAAAHIFVWDGKYDSNNKPICALETGFASTTPTPIPAAAWLLGSGVLGMIGLRRKKSA